MGNSVVGSRLPVPAVLSPESMNSPEYWQRLFSKGKAFYFSSACHLCWKIPSCLWKASSRSVEIAGLRGDRPYFVNVETECGGLGGVRSISLWERTYVAASSAPKWGALWLKGNWFQQIYIEHLLCSRHDYGSGRATFMRNKDGTYLHGAWFSQGRGRVDDNKITNWIIGFLPCWAFWVSWSLYVILQAGSRDKWPWVFSGHSFSWGSERVPVDNNTFLGFK